MWWAIIGGAILAIFLWMLIASWRMDHRGTGRKGKYIEPPSNDPDVGEAKSRRYFRNMGNTGYF